MSDQGYFDCHAWHDYPHHRDWFNKLKLSLTMGYYCGPCGVPPDREGDYIIRPIYNLTGMGAGARRVHIGANDVRQVEPGSFWCEWFNGPQHSVTYRWDGRWVPMSSWRGTLAPGSLYRFERWQRSDFVPQPPAVCDELADVEVINVEYIGDRLIEVHLRPSPDPDGGNEIVPVWADDPVEGFVAAFEDGDGFLPVARLGFIVR